MNKGLLDPKVDFVFKNIFGSEKNPEILISFLNAILKPKFPINHVEIREAKNQLVKMSNDKTQRGLYEMREKRIKDEISALSKAKEEGIKEGIKEGEKEGIIKTAKNLLAMGLDLETISKATGLSIDEIKSLRN